MTTSTLPLPLLKTVLPLVPRPFLAQAVRIVWSRMDHRHPKLLKNLARLDPALVYLEPTDLPLSFGMTLGQDPCSFYLLSPEEKETREPDARVRGDLASLIDMLEGRADGDTLFFARDIQITGNTAVIVALRNTLDREEMDVFSELLSLCGPFAPQARFALGLAERVASKTKERLHHVHEGLHRGKASS